MKDPAILFYTSDFLNGCACLTLEERGQYITMLCLQHQLGHLSEKVIKINVGNISDDVMRKFQQDENGLYFQKRMDDEINKRKGFTESRRANAKAYAEHMPIHMPQHMENENENIINNREIEFKKEVAEFKNYPEEMLTAFSDYWTEPNKSKTKMRFELQKTFDIKRRLNTWYSRESATATKAPAYAPKYKTYDEMCQLALNNKDIWQQMTAVKLPDMPKTVWAHPNDVVKHNLTKYAVK